MNKKIIVEKQLGISGDYQYRALRSRNFLQSNWHRNKWFVINRLLELYKPEKVLDLGTGSGNFELLFSKRLKNIVGVDYNDEALKFLKAELNKKGIRNVRLVNNDIADVWKMPNLGIFDMVILVDVIEHLDIDTGEKLILKLRKFLRPKGKIIIITPNYGGFWPVIERYVIDKLTHLPNLENMQHVTKYDKSVLSNVFERYGYKQVKYSTFNTISYILPGRNLSEFVCKLELALALPFGNLLLCVFEIRD